MISFEWWLVKTHSLSLEQLVSAYPFPVSFPSLLNPHEKKSNEETTTIYMTVQLIAREEIWKNANSSTPCLVTQVNISRELQRNHIVFSFREKKRAYITLKLSLHCRTELSWNEQFSSVQSRRYEQGFTCNERHTCSFVFGLGTGKARIESYTVVRNNACSAILWYIRLQKNEIIMIKC